MLQHTELEFNDIQGIVLRIYLTLLYKGAAVFVHFDSPEAGRAWLREVTPLVTTVEAWDELVSQHREEIEELLNLSEFDKARLGLMNRDAIRAGIENRVNERLQQFRDLLGRRRGAAGTQPAASQPDQMLPTTTVNVALTFRGLEALGRPAAELESYPRHFREGMYAHAEDLGDIGLSRTELWDAPFRAEDQAPDTAVHAVLLLHARDDEELGGLLEWQEQAAQDSGVRVLATQLGSRLPSFTEHFGFKDGIGSPAVHGDTVPAFPGQDRVKAGEFVLGYGDEDDRRYDEVLRPEDAPEEDFETEDRYLKNGSFLVYRKLKQNVVAFRTFLKEKGGGDPELLAAKMVGRWRSGAPLARSPGADDPALGADFMRNNDFDYKDDLTGEHVPVGAHIRRANPRSGEVHGVARHRVMRRGIPYGPLLPPDATVDDGEDRGVLFLFIGASIRRQFLFVQQAWMNDSDFHRRIVTHDEDQDPIIGAHEMPEHSGYSIPGASSTQRVTGLPNFVATRGGEFFFAPGVRALRYLAGAAE